MSLHLLIYLYHHLQYRKKTLFGSSFDWFSDNLGILRPTIGLDTLHQDDFDVLFSLDNNLTKAKYIMLSLSVC